MALVSSLRLAVRAQARCVLSSAPTFAAPAPRFAAPLLHSFRAFSDVKFTGTHEWLRKDGDTYVMGISDFAANALGEVVYCDLPEEGASFSAKETLATLESVKAVGEVYAPVDCEVLEVNEKLQDEPAMVNSSAETDGWLVKVKISGDLPSELMDRAAYDQKLAEEKED